MTRTTYPTVCHPDRVNTGRGLCCACYQYWKHAERNELRTPRAESLRAIVATHESRKTTVNVSAQTKQRERARSMSYETRRDRILRSRYGIGVAEYATLAAQQNGRCAICACEPKQGAPLHVDHCHRTGRVRGLLCARCNGFMAKVDVDAVVVDRLREYMLAMDLGRGIAPDGAGAGGDGGR